jgi:hypothetical protein
MHAMVAKLGKRGMAMRSTRARRDARLLCDASHDSRSETLDSAIWPQNLLARERACASAIKTIRVPTTFPPSVQYSSQKPRRSREEVITPTFCQPSSSIESKRWVGTLSRSGVRLRLPAPRHKFVDAILRPTVDEARQQLGHVGQRIDFMELTGFD